MDTIITKEKIENARKYMPLAMKLILAETIASWCVKKDDSESSIERYHEQKGLRQRLLMGVLARFYLNMDFECDKVKLVEDGKDAGEQEIDYFPTAEAYDELSGAFIMNQLERMKKEKEVANSVYDICYDYKAFEQMVHAEIREQLEKKNDVLRRIYSVLTQNISEDALKKLVNDTIEKGDAEDAR